MEAKILAYVDGRLKDSERPDFEKHLAGCAACKLRVSEFRAVHSLLDELPQIEPSAAFDLRVHALVAAEPAKLGWWSWLTVSPRAAVAAAMLLLATVWIGTRKDHRSVIAEQDLPVVENADYDVICRLDIGVYWNGPTDPQQGICYTKEGAVFPALKTK